MTKCPIIYDASCPFCRRWTGRIRSVDRNSRFEFIPNEDPALPSRFPQLRSRDLQKSIHFLDEDGQIYTGAAAAYQIALRAPLTRPIAFVFRLPGAQKVYEFISKYRKYL